MTRVSLPNGKHFEANPGELLLDAALRAGIALEHSCRSGRCGTCRARVHDGISVAGASESGLTPTERDAGWILTCVRTAESDLQLEAQVLDVRLRPARTWPCRIHHLEPLAPDVLKIVLRLPPTADFSYLPGQYVDVIGPAGARRSYSIANAAGDDKLLELHVRRVAQGEMSAYWFEQAKTGDLLRLHGPLGTFFLREIADLDLVFLATGTGIAPVKAMLEDLTGTAPQRRPRSITVYWGGRTPCDLYWRPHESDWLRFVPVLSRPDADWAGQCGHVQDALLAGGVAPSGMAVYACGSDAMIHDARTSLLEAGLRPDRFLSDAFVCSASGR